MKRLFVGLVICMFVTSAVAQTGADSLHKAAKSICNCLSKADIGGAKTEEDLQQLFIKCMLDSAQDIIVGLFGDATDEETTNKLAEKIGMEMLSSGCPAFLNLSIKMTKLSTGGDKPTAAIKTAAGTVVKVEEKDFLYITVKNEAGELTTLILLSDVDGSADWIKDPVNKLLNKKVNIGWVEKEVYQPKLKDFADIKEITKLSLQ